MKTLTNAEAKQEAIKKAWMEIGVTDRVLHNDGWLKLDLNKISEEAISEFPADYFETKKFDGNIMWFRPKSITGINDNNGWTRIEPDGSNLPTDDKVKYKVGTLCFDGTFEISHIHFTASTVKLSGGTHYKPIIEEPKPIY